ncbi:MAG: glycosyltransferase family 2 protein [Elusimicrobia bacterium]|nr:glycosyltransferase family 2 protein [Elusimicrobiota bacterium]
MTQRHAARPLASIIILCHNDRKYLRGCVASIRRFTPEPHELIFVDNDSQDGAYEDLVRIQKTSKVPVRVIRNKENRFFAGGNNQGMRAARGENLVLLNADTVVTPGWLSGLADCAKRDERVGLVGPYTNQAAGLQVLWPPSYGTPKELPEWSRAWSRERRGRARQAPWLVGFCFLIPRRVVGEVGLLDERFGPGGFEDYDYCLRVRLAGYELAIAEDVYIHHFGGRGYANMRYEELRGGNRRVYWDKWSQWTRDRFARGGARQDAGLPALRS